MIINLPNGKTIEVSAEVYLRMTDEDFEYLVSINCGDDVTNPFEASVLLYGEAKQDEDYEENNESSEPSDLDKLLDLDAETLDDET
jgi:hypothetical protein